MELTHDISIIKHRYRKLFPLAHQKLLERFRELAVNHSCDSCYFPPEAVDKALHTGCGYIEWQKEAIIMLDKDIGREILLTLERIKDAKQVKGCCKTCGSCCSLASSEFSYSQLKDKAQNGNDFAKQFTSVFLPYESSEKARARFPELVSEILDQADEEVFFYYCPHIDSNNRCTIYNSPSRPELCANYPETPLILMHGKCGYKSWKEDMLETTLLAHATLELCQHYVNRIYYVIVEKTV